MFDSLGLVFFNLPVRGFVGLVVPFILLLEKLILISIFIQVASRIEISEGQSAHFEARLTPTEDPNMKVREP